MVKYSRLKFIKVGLMKSKSLNLGRAQFLDLETLKCTLIAN